MEFDTKQKKKISNKSKSIIATVIDRCRKEKDSKALHLPLDDYQGRVSFYTGLSKTYICKLTDKFVDLEIDLFDLNYHNAIRREIHLMYNKKISPTYKSVYEAVCKSGKKIPYSQFYFVMSTLGYDYRKMDEGYLLMEDPKLTFERYNYLSKIKKLRAKGHKIYYIDERVMELPSLKFEKTWQVENPDQLKQADTLFHIVSNTGYENGLYCRDATPEMFLKWVSDIVVPDLIPSSVIVMVNSPLHGLAPNDILTRYHSKDDMVKALKLQNIPCSENMRKPELYQLIEKCSVRQQQNNVDRFLKACGHEVLCLPHNLQNLLLTEFLWYNVKRKFQNINRNLFNYTSLKESISIHIDALKAREWNMFESALISQEKEIFNLDRALENNLENFKFDHAVCESVAYDVYDSYEED